MTKILCDRCGKLIPYNHAQLPNYDTLCVTRIDSSATDVLGPLTTHPLDLCSRCQAYIFDKIVEYYEEVDGDGSK